MNIECKKQLTIMKYHRVPSQALQVNSLEANESLSRSRELEVFNTLHSLEFSYKSEKLYIRRYTGENLQLFTTYPVNTTLKLLKYGVS